MAVLYFAAVGVAFLNDRRRARRAAVRRTSSDDEASPIEPVSPVDAPDVGLARYRYDDDNT